MDPPIAIDPAVIERYVRELARHGACGETGVCRPAYSPAWVAAQEQIGAWYAEAGLSTWRDAAGSVWGRRAGREPGLVVATGSHIDSVVPGGRHDGALGVIAGIVAVRALQERFGPPRRSIDVVSFAQEENSRFPSSGFWSSRSVTGRARPEELDTIRTYEGETLREVLGSVGLDPAEMLSARRDDIAAFIELHVEQGPVLEEAGLAVGIVDAITGSSTFNVTVTGRADHAGGCPMDLRRDPMTAVVPIVDGVLRTARAMGRPAVTTVGRMLVEPNFSGIVPERVVFTVNARHPYPDGYAELQRRHTTLLEEVRAAHPELGIDWTVRTGPPTPCDAGMVRMLEEVAREQGIATLTMPSGGGHDTEVMAGICPSAMIFVQSRDGRSHTPEEYTAPEHAAAGVQLLAAALHRLAH